MVTESTLMLHILIVDDNPDDRLLIKRELNRTLPTAVSTEITNQIEFDTAINKNDYDLVITDYQIYWTNGIKVLNAVKRKNTDIPVVMYTGTGSEEIAVSAMRLGLDDYILKGNERIVRLSGVVKSLLRRKEDASIRAEIQDTLEQKSLMLDAFFDNALDLFCIANMDGYFIRLNREWQNTLGYKLNDLEGHRFLDFVHPDDIQPTLEVMKILSDQKKVLNFTNRYRAIDDSFKWIEWRSTTAGNLIYAAARDITDRVEINNKLELALAAAQQGEKVKALFLANMSHEIRTPLNSLLGFTEILGEKVKEYLDEEDLECFEIIRSSGKRLTSTIHGILDISQIEAGIYQYEPTIVQLASLIDLIYKEFKPAARKKNLTFTFDNQIGTGTVEVDDISVQKSIANLIDNAIKYTEKGHVTLKLSGEDDKYILSIADTGVGIKEKYLSNIYDVFSQESEGYNKKYQGLGIGLSISKQYLDINKIPIKVESKKGHGTTIQLTFTPVDAVIENTKFQESPDVSETVNTGRKGRPMILIVEDDENNRKTLEVILKKDYETCSAESVGESKKRLTETDVDLILLDLSLRGMEDGLDFAKYMQTQKFSKRIPIIAVTAHALREDRENVLNAGCDDFVSKPINIEQLLKKISQLI